MSPRPSFHGGRGSAATSPSVASHHLYTRLRAAHAVIVKAGGPPHRAVADGDMRRRPVAWVDADTLSDWRAQNLLAPHPRGWRVVARTAPRPITIQTESGPRHVAVHENWMQRLARDLDLPAPLAEAGHRLVADGRAVAAGSLRTGATSDYVDGNSAHDGEEQAIHFRLDARRRVRDALAGLSRTERVCAEAICVHDRSLDEAAEMLGLDRAATRGVLLFALTRLAQHYGTFVGR